MRKIALLAVTLLALAPAAAQANGGRLDPKFGRHGRTVIGRVTGVSTLFAAVGPGNETAIVTSRQVALVNARGHLERRFGEAGVIDLPVAAGTVLEPSGLAVDGDGRILIAGTSYRPGVSTPPADSVVVERLLPDGRLDPTFGAGGRVESTLGLPAAPVYGGPSASAKGIAVDSRGRAVVAGSFVTETRICETYMGTFSAEDSHQGFVARLTRGGQLDPTFAAGGVHTAGAPTLDSLPLVDRAGRITYGEQASPESISPTGCPQRGIIAPTLLRGLRPSGAPRAGFDARQSRPLLYTSAAAQDSEMRTILLGGTLSSNAMGNGGEEVVRVEPSGAVDRSFGERGHAPASTDQQATVRAMAVDRRDRVVVAGHIAVAGRIYGGFYVGRLTADGETDVHFGLDGSARISFAGASTEALAVAVDSRGRIVLVGSAHRRGEYVDVLALSRYLPGGGHHHRGKQRPRR